MQFPTSTRIFIQLCTYNYYVHIYLLSSFSSLEGAGLALAPPAAVPLAAAPPPSPPLGSLPNYAYNKRSSSVTRSKHTHGKQPTN